MTKDFRSEKERQAWIKRMQEIYDASPREELVPRLGLYELSFLKDMISGQFNGRSVDDFTNQGDKRLFLKYNALSKKEQKEAYKEYQRKLDAEIPKIP